MMNNVTKLINSLNTETLKEINNLFDSKIELSTAFTFIFEPSFFIKLDLQNEEVYIKLVNLCNQLMEGIFPLTLLLKDNSEKIESFEADLLSKYRNQQKDLLTNFIKIGLPCKFSKLNTDKIFKEKDDQINFVKVVLPFNEIVRRLPTEIIDSRFNSNEFFDTLNFMEVEFICEVLNFLAVDELFYSILCCIKSYSYDSPLLKEYLLDNHRYIYFPEYEKLYLFDIIFYLNKRAIYFLNEKVRYFQYSIYLDKITNHMHTILNNYNIALLDKSINSYVLYDVLLNCFDKFDSSSYLNFMFTRKRELHLNDLILYLQEKIREQFWFFLTNDEYKKAVKNLFKISHEWLERKSYKKSGYLVFKINGKNFLSELDKSDLEDLCELHDLEGLEINSKNIKESYVNLLKELEKFYLENESLIKKREQKKLADFSNYEKFKRFRFMQKNILELFDFLDYHKNILPKDMSMEYIKKKSCLMSEFFNIENYAIFFLENILSLKYEMNQAEKIFYTIFLREKYLSELIVKNIMMIFPLSSPKTRKGTGKEKMFQNKENIKNLHFIAIFFGKLLNLGLIKYHLYTKSLLFLKDCFKSRNIKIIELGKVVLDHFPLIKECKQWREIVLAYDLFNNIEIKDGRRVLVNENINLGLENNLIIGNMKSEKLDFNLLMHKILCEKIENNYALEFLKNGKLNRNGIGMLEIRNELFLYHQTYEFQIKCVCGEKNQNHNFFKKIFEPISDICEESIESQYFILKLLNLLVDFNLEVQLEEIKILGINTGLFINKNTIKKNKMYTTKIIDFMKLIFLYLENQKMPFLVYFLMGLFSDCGDNPCFDLLAPFSNKFIQILSLMISYVPNSIELDIRSFLDKRIDIFDYFNDIRSPTSENDFNRNYDEFMKPHFYSFNACVRSNPFLLLSRDYKFITTHIKNILEKTDKIPGDICSYDISLSSSRYLKIVSQAFLNRKTKKFIKPSKNEPNYKKMDPNLLIFYFEKKVKEKIRIMNHNISYKLKGSKIIKRVLKISIDFTITNTYEDIERQIKELVSPIINSLKEKRYAFDEFYAKENNKNEKSNKNEKTYKIKNLKNKIYGNTKLMSYPLLVNLVDCFLKIIIENVFKERLLKNVEYIFSRAKLPFTEIISGNFFKENLEAFNYIFLSKITDNLVEKMESENFVFVGMIKSKSSAKTHLLSPLRKLELNDQIVMNIKELEEKIDLLACHVPLEETTEISLTVEKLKEIFYLQNDSKNVKRFSNLSKILIKNIKEVNDLDKTCINITEDLLGLLMQKFNIQLYSLLSEIMLLSAKTKSLVTDWLIYSPDERKYNANLMTALIKDGILNYKELDLFVSKNLITEEEEKIYQTTSQKKCLEFLEKLLKNLPVYFFISTIHKLEIINKKVKNQNQKLSKQINEILLNSRKYGLEDIETFNFEKEFKFNLYRKNNENIFVRKYDLSVLTAQFLKEGIKNSKIWFLKGIGDEQKYERLQFLIEKYTENNKNMERGLKMFEIFMERLFDDLHNQNYTFLEFYIFYFVNSNNLCKFLKIINLRKMSVFAFFILKILNYQIGNGILYLTKEHSKINSECRSRNTCYTKNSDTKNSDTKNSDTKNYELNQNCCCSEYKKNTNKSGLVFREIELKNLTVDFLKVLDKISNDELFEFNNANYAELIFDYFLMLKNHLPKFFIENAVSFNFFVSERFPQLKNLLLSVSFNICENCDCPENVRIQENEFIKLTFKGKRFEKIKKRRDLHYALRHIKNIKEFEEMRGSLRNFSEEILLISLINNLNDKMCGSYFVLLEMEVSEFMEKILNNRIHAGNPPFLLKKFCKSKNISIEKK